MKSWEARSGRSVLIFSEEFDFQGPGVQNRPKLEIRKIWDSEIKSSTKYVYRQTSGKPEKNILNKKGWVMNPILNIQSLNPKHFNLLRRTVVNDIFGSKKINKK